MENTSFTNGNDFNTKLSKRLNDLQSRLEESTNEQRPLSRKTIVRNKKTSPPNTRPNTPNNYGGKSNKNRTRKNRANNKTNKTNKNRLLESFQKEITVIFFELLLMIKLFHWNTHSYATHKATDKLYSSFNENMDKFTEVLLGKSGQRIDLYNVKHIRLEYLISTDKLKQRIESFKSYLVSLDNKPAMKLMSNSDLLNIRDELLGNMNQFLYLLTLK